MVHPIRRVYPPLASTMPHVRPLPVYAASLPPMVRRSGRSTAASPPTPWPPIWPVLPAASPPPSMVRPIRRATRPTTPAPTHGVAIETRQAYRSLEQGSSRVAGAVRVDREAPLRSGIRIPDVATAGPLGVSIRPVGDGPLRDLARASGTPAVSIDNPWVRAGVVGRVARRGGQSVRPMRRVDRPDRADMGWWGEARVAGQIGRTMGMVEAKRRRPPDRRTHGHGGGDGG